MTYSLGWRFDDEDFGHLRLTATRLPRQKIEAIAYAFDLRSWLPIQDQGWQQSCTGHALATCMEVLYWLQTNGRKRRLSRRFAYLTSQKMEGFLGKDIGSTLSATTKGAKVFGVCRERRLPMQDLYDDSLPLRAIEESAKYRIVSHSILENYDDVLLFLSAGWGPALLGLTWQESLITAGEVIDQVEGSSCGHHVLAIVGYTHEVTDDLGRPFLIVANSHGRRWGKKGFALVAPELFDDWGQHPEAIMLGVSDMFTYQRRVLPASGGKPAVVAMSSESSG